jgi:RND family efflux transporter MFP subunit
VVTVARPVEAESAAFDFPCRLAPAEVVEVRAPLTGVVEKVHSRPGAEVKAGAALLDLAPRNLKQDLAQAAADVKRREAELRKAEKALAQAQKPAKKKADEFDVAQARAARDLAATLLKLARAEGERLRQDQEAAHVKAPIAGRVVSIAAAGDQVEGGARLASRLAVLARTDPVRASFVVDEKTLLHLRELLRKRGAAGKAPTDVPARLRLPGEKAFGHMGALEVVDNRVDPKSGRVHVSALFPNPDGALTAALSEKEKKAADGQAGKEKEAKPAFVRLTLAEPRKLLLLPGWAVGDEQGVRFVFVVDEKNALVKRPVKLGPLLDGLQAIEGGLEADAWVVINAGEAERDPEDTSISPDDFTRDARLRGLRPGLTVRPVRTALSRPGADKQP